MVLVHGKAVKKLTLEKMDRGPGHTCFMQYALQVIIPNNKKGIFVLPSLSLHQNMHLTC